MAGMGRPADVVGFVPTVEKLIGKDLTKGRPGGPRKPLLCKKGIVSPEKLELDAKLPSNRRSFKVIHFDVPREKLSEFCRSRHIRWMACFGSAVRDDFGPDSDVDLLVEFAPGHVPGWDIVDIEEDLSSLLGGRKVDVVSPKYLNPRLRDRILAEAEVLYAEG